MSARAWHWRRWNSRCALESEYGDCSRRPNHKGEHATFIGGGQKFLPSHRKSKGGREVWFGFGLNDQKPGYRIQALR
jgi:hypothetical protein